MDAKNINESCFKNILTQGSEIVIVLVLSNILQKLLVVKRGEFVLVERKIYIM